MKILAVRIGDRYGPEYEEYLESKLPDADFIWIREPIQDNIMLQWNKIAGMNLDLDEPLCVMDIDVILTHNYMELFEYPIKRGQFLHAPNWWRGNSAGKWRVNGGFYKYYPKDCKYIYDKFMATPEYWQAKYILDGTTTGPVNGEQHFIEEAANERLEVISLPDAWFCRMESRESERHYISSTNRLYKEKTGNDYMFLGGEFHPDIKFVHFTNMSNMPENWRYYRLFV